MLVGSGSRCDNAARFLFMHPKRPFGAFWGDLARLGNADDNLYHQGRRNALNALYEVE